MGGGGAAKPNAYLLLLISDLIIKLKGSKYFTKLDIRWGYNNIHIKEGDEWKAKVFTLPHTFCVDSRGLPV